MPTCFWPEFAEQSALPGIESLSRASSYNAAGQLFLERLVRRLSSSRGCLWSVDPVRRLLVRVATVGALPHRPPIVLSCDTDRRGAAVARKSITRHSHRDTATAGTAHGLTNNLRGGPLQSIYVPVLNSFNSNQVLFLADVECDQVLPSELEAPISEAAAAFAAQFEVCLHDACSFWATQLQLETRKLKRRTPIAICRVLTKVLSAAVGSDAVDVLLPSPEVKGLCVTTEPQPAYAPPKSELSAGPSFSCWTSNRELITIDVLSETGSEAEFLQFDNATTRLAGAFAPLRDVSGQPKGVVRCLNCYTAEGAGQAFTYEHLAVIDAVSQAIPAYLNLIEVEQSRQETFGKLAHEFHVPVVAFGAVLERLQRECLQNKYLFSHDHFEELEIYRDVMRRLLTELDLVRKGKVPLSVRPVKIDRSIIAPAKRFIQPLLARKGLSAEGVVYDGVADFPKLHLDPALMTQLVFNLMDNAIKYSASDPTEFSLKITGSIGRGVYELAFEDSGIGVPEFFVDRLFRLGMRGPNAKQVDAVGEGIGLWFSREVARKHNGDLVLAHAKDPTVFVLRLPESLAVEPPAEKREGSDEEGA